ncbi:hypothetical protein T492DRAFT_847553 [Pavlovales sp. CCMP2436]|nr:hypothetical protein T492DRAFT_847553 [Pavlovales sp. CCMP2436]
MLLLRASVASAGRSCAAPKLGACVRQYASVAASTGRSCAAPKLGACVRHRSVQLHTVPWLQRAAQAQAPRPSLLASPLLKRSLWSGSSGSAFERAQSVRGKVLHAFAMANENRFVVLTIAGALVGMYGFYRVTVKAMPKSSPPPPPQSFLLNVSDATIFNIGFVAGLVTAAIVVVAAIATHRYTSLSIDGLKHVALLRAQQDGRVAQKLGGNYFEAHPMFRAYTFETLSDAIFGTERRVRSSYLELPARRARLMFQPQFTEDTVYKEIYLLIV